MLIELQWTVTRSENGNPREYHAQLPSGAVAYVRCDDDLWISIVQVRGAPDQAATFATAYDAQTAIAGDEVRRLIELGARAAAVNRERRAQLSTSGDLTSNVLRTKRAQAG